MGEQPQPVVAVNWDNEHITPYSFDIELADNTMSARYAVSHHSAIYDINFLEKGQPRYIMINSQQGAITVENNLSRVDPEKCVGCGKCVEKCPTKSIRFL